MFKNGANNFISKPFSKKDIVGVIEKARLLREKNNNSFTLNKEDSVVSKNPQKIEEKISNLEENKPILVQENSAEATTSEGEKLVKADVSVMNWGFFLKLQIFLLIAFVVLRYVYYKL